MVWGEFLSRFLVEVSYLPSFSARVMASSKIFSPSSTSVLGYAQRRGDTNDTLAARKQDQAAFEGQFDHTVAERFGRGLRLAILDEFHANHQADAAYVADGGVACHDLMQSILCVLARRGGIFQIFIFDQINRCEGGRAGKWVATESVAVRAAWPIHHGFTGQAGAQRHPGSDALWQ